MFTLNILAASFSLSIHRPAGSLSGIWRAAVASTILRRCLHTENERIFLFRTVFLLFFVPYARCGFVCSLACASCTLFSHSLALRLFWSVGGYFAPSHERKKIYQKPNHSSPSMRTCNGYQCYQNSASDSKRTTIQCYGFDFDMRKKLQETKNKS